LEQRLKQDSLALTPSLWREVLRNELVDSGFEQDMADLVARRVIERMVRGCLRGDLDASPPATRSLDEAA
jgi:hypothetical protein